MIQDRIKELRRVKASSLLANPLNYRKHPPRQKALLSQLLSEVGYADALLAYETPQGLRLVDGHLRAETTPDQEVPVLVLDVTEQEANKLLLTLDPLAGLAETDTLALEKLLAQTDASGELGDWLKERAEALELPTPKEQPPPVLRGEHLIEISCSSDDLKTFRETLDQWSQREGVKVSII